MAGMAVRQGNASSCGRKVVFRCRKEVEMISMLFPILFPIIAGLFLLVMKEPKNRKALLGITGGALLVTGAFVAHVMFRANGKDVILFWLTASLPVYLKLDKLGLLFMAVVSVVWILAGFFAFSYMKPEEESNGKIDGESEENFGKESHKDKKRSGEKRFYGFYLMVFGILNGLGLAGNLVTFYIFYESMTLLSMPLVIHTRSREAIMASLKYLFYSFCGAYMVLFGLFFLNRFGNTLTFTPGGVLDKGMVVGNEGLLLVTAFLMLLGFGVKAGMFPLHAWLPSAHPVAPAPASAALSAVIVKGGVLGLIRVAYYMFGADFLRGTWVQTAWLVLALITVFMGSMLAYREKLLKKRLAYSTVSQASYILFGLALLQPVALEGALLHMVFHALIKSVLFLVAGAVIHKTGKARVEELTGIGKEMPGTIWCFAFASLALIGIPPTSGFISKWYLATGALDSGTGIFTWLGPVILLVSALLTAGYLLPIVMKGFFPGEGYNYKECQSQRDKCGGHNSSGEIEKKKGFFIVKEDPCMLIPIMVLTALAVGLGVWPNPLVEFVSGIVSGIL